MKIKYIFLFFLLINSLQAISQIPAVDYLKTILEKIDSTTISTVHYNESEMIQPMTVDENNIDRKTYTLNSSLLSKQEIKTFVKKLNNIDKGGVASGHYDIELNFYIKDSIFSIVRISSYMKSILIQNIKIECDNYDDLWKTQCYYLGSISKSFQQYITALLRQKKLWSKNESFYEW